MEEWGKVRLQGGIGVCCAEEMRGEEEEGFRHLVVPCAVEVGAVRKHTEGPVKHRGKFVSVSAGIEEH